MTLIWLIAFVVIVVLLLYIIQQLPVNGPPNIKPILCIIVALIAVLFLAMRMGIFSGRI